MMAEPPRAPRPRRSALYMPGSNARALEKARSLPADALILDLEDAVAPAEKERAREQVCRAASDGRYAPREVAIRVNALATPWGEADVAAAARSGADALVLPKVESRADVERAVALLDAAGAPAGVELWCMIETPLGVLRAAEIASAGGRLACLLMGTADLAKDLRLPPGPAGRALATSLGLCLLAARAFGLSILDGVFVDLADDEGFAASCAEARAMGFDGKTLIHPKQIEICNRTFLPTAEELAEAREIVAAHREALAQGKGVAVVRGKLVERLHVDAAERALAAFEAATNAS